MTRFRPSRAGLINIWDYVDEEFVFADGRLVLRGHNGSGKTKALEVLFPFILDGIVDARRLDPFSGENRTMKSNLLYRGQDAEYGFVWMEFADGPRTVTLIAALRAHKDKDPVTTSFFVTPLRIGVDFGLLTADSRPLTERQLKQILGADACYDSATDYRAAIDAELFELGPQRYEQLIDLLLALRRPLLAKDLDPDKVSDTLTAGLSPVSDGLIDQAARDFENLAAVQRLAADLAVTDTAAHEFLDVYRTYLRTQTRFHLGKVTEHTRQSVNHLTTLRQAVSEAERAAAAEKAALAARDTALQRQTQLAGTLAGLKQHDAYQNQGDLESLREQVSLLDREIDTRRGRLDKSAQRLSRVRDEAHSVSAEIARGRAVGARHAAEQQQAARRAGIEHSDADLPTAKARAATRQHEVQQVLEHLARFKDAAAHQQHVNDALTSAQTRLQEADQRCRQAEDAAQRARGEAEELLQAWAQRWGADPADPDPLITADDLAALTDALDRFDNASEPSLQAVFTDFTEERRSGTAEERARLAVDLQTRGAQRQQLVDERQRIAAHEDDAPVLPATRRSDRAFRPGGALWQLVRFADHVDDEQAAALEAALEAAGLLTAWVHPDADLTAAALAEGHSDAYLQPLPHRGRPDGPTLADFLIPEEHHHVPASTITDILACIAVSPALDARTPGPAISTAGQFTYGIQIGACTKSAPEFIGAAHRAARRLQRLADYDQQIAAVTLVITSLQQRLDQLDERLRHLLQAKSELPALSGISAALADLIGASALLASARTDHAEAATTLDTATATTEAVRRRLRQSAGERNLPTDPQELKAVDRAVSDYLDHAEHHHAQHRTTTALEDDLEKRQQLISDLETEHRDGVDELTDKQQTHLELSEKLTALEAALTAPLQEILAEIEAAESGLRQARDDQSRAEERAGIEHDAHTRALSAQEHGQRALADSLTAFLAAAQAIAPFTEPNLRPVLNIATTRSWPHRAHWPTVEHATHLLLEQTASGQAEQDVHALLPEDAAELLHLLDQATHDQPTPETNRKDAAQRLSVALKDFGDILHARDEDYRLTWEADDLLITVRVDDADGRHPIAAFTTQISSRSEEQRLLLEERERTVLEDELLSTIAQQIFERVFVARELVAGMDDDTRSRPMSNGTTIGIRWVTAPKLTDLQREVSQLLDLNDLGPRQLTRLRDLLRRMLHEYRAAHPRATYKQALEQVLDYRAWRAFELRMKAPGQQEVKLTRKQHSLMSGGEKAAAIHLPLFAAANALYSSAKPDCPRMIALDEAFAGIDDNYKPDLLGLTVKYQLDAFMTGHDLWVHGETVPAAAHYDMHADKLSHTVSAVLILWDGTELTDSGTGFTSNEELAARILGFTPTRHTPAALGLLELHDDEAEEDQEAAV